MTTDAERHGAPIAPPPYPPLPSKKLATHALRARVLVAVLLELLEQFTLAVGQALRRLDLDSPRRSAP